MKLQELVKAQRDFSLETFGEDVHPQSITNHLRQELIEIQEDTNDLSEWADALLLALEGWWRAGTKTMLNYFDPIDMTSDKELLRTYARKLRHLSEHLERLELAHRQPEMYELMAAQIFIVATGYGHDAQDLMREAYLKIEINKRREWHKPADPTQPFKHLATPGI